MARTKRGDTPAECFTLLSKMTKGEMPVTVVCYSHAEFAEYAAFFKKKGKKAENISVRVADDEDIKNERRSSNDGGSPPG